jgi:arabinose-5-phosphate isomerase
VGKSLIEIAKAVLQTEADSVLALKDRIDNNFDKVCNTLKGCRGKVILIGIGQIRPYSKKNLIYTSINWNPFFLFAPWRGRAW